MSTFVENIALELLARDGVPAVWQLHLAAAKAHRDGFTRAADALLQIADAVEQELARGFGQSISDHLDGAAWPNG
jgi:hypothetical protein